jgi:YggT family protein
VTGFLTAYAAGYAVLRWIVFGVAALLAVVFVADWLVRTRRIGPFSPVARFVRRSVSPLLAPVERRVVRSGGSPQNAPWWALVGVVVGGIVLLSVAQFVGAQIVQAGLSVSMGTRGVVRLLVSWLFGLLQIALLVRVVSSWVGGSPYSPWLRWAYVLTEPILAPLRRIIPTIGMIDITPIVAYFLLRLLASLVIGIL